MKTLTCYSTLLFLLFLTSCNSGGGTENPKTSLEKITTKWKVLKWLKNNENHLPTGEATWTFNADKTFDLSVSNGVVMQKGKWELKEQDSIIITFEDDPEYIKAKCVFENNKLIIDGEMDDESPDRIPYKAELETINK